jgi:hypothetical protein
MGAGRIDLLHEIVGVRGVSIGVEDRTAGTGKRRLDLWRQDYDSCNVLIINA